MSEIHCTPIPYDVKNLPKSDSHKLVRADYYPRLRIATQSCRTISFGADADPNICTKSFQPRRVGGMKRLSPDPGCSWQQPKQFSSLVPESPTTSSSVDPHTDSENVVDSGIRFVNTVKIRYCVKMLNATVFTYN